MALKAGIGLEGGAGMPARMAGSGTGMLGGGIGGSIGTAAGATATGGAAGTAVGGGRNGCCCCEGLVPKRLAGICCIGGAGDEAEEPISLFGGV